MQQFTVPQFIDVEDKIIGPITTRQFLILLVGAIFVAIFYKTFDFSLFVFSSVIVAVIAFIIAFIKINGRPFHYFALNLIQTLKKPNLRVWNKTYDASGAIEDDEIEKVERMPTKTINLRSSRLDQMSLIVDTYGQYRGDDLVAKEK
jgi:hypothetical protein